MELQSWIILFFVIQLLHGLATFKLYVKAGRQAWEAFVPVYNAVILMKIINRPWWWTILLFLPIVNLIMFPVIWVEISRSFGKYSTTDTILSIITLGFYSFYLSYAQDLTYVENRDLNPRTAAGDWISSILFAIVAATIVHTYFMQPFVIPTSSLEKTLLVGDFLFVSKFHYGARTPQTAIALPMVHDVIPTTTVPSYLEKPQLPKFRFPGFQKIKRNDIVVFNWPVDTLVDITNPYGEVKHKPLDKKSNYVKRCVGLPGDNLEVRNGFVFIDGKQNELPSRAKLQFFYRVVLKDNAAANAIKKQYGITEDQYVFQLKKTMFEDNRLQAYFKANNINLNILHTDSENVFFNGNISQDVFNKLSLQFSNNVLSVNLTDELAAEIKKNPNVISVTKDIATGKDIGIFPKSPDYSWNRDNFGPLYIPEAGKTVPLNIDVLPLYKRLITAYEGNELKVNGNQILINGKVVTDYTFKLDYYWMMGDNRHNSQDARAWGFVPQDHVVGKPVMVWMSWDSNATGLNKIRWNRLFTTVSGEGKATSFLIPVLILIGLYFGYTKYKKRKKEQA